MSGRRVVVTGLGIVSPFGIGKDLFWEKVTAGKSGARLITQFDTEFLPTRFAAPLEMAESDLDQHVANRRTLKTLSRAGKLAMISAQEAVQDAGLDISTLDPYRTGTSIGAGGVGLWDLEHSNQLLNILGQSLAPSGEIGTNMSLVWERVSTEVHPLSTLKALPNILTSHIAIYCNARGPSLTITTACTSSAQAIGEAYRQIALGQADVMVTGGSDAMINPYGMVAFSMLGVMSTNNDHWQKAARPFDKTRDGFMMGEGASILVLEEAEHCRKRGATALAEIRGYASTCDAYRLTDEPPSAWGSIHAMKTALEAAAVSPDSVDYINAHGTGTQMNDRTETYAIKTVLGHHASEIPVSSTKSMTGHLIAAAGAIECSTCILSLRHQVITPTINYSVPDNDCDLDYVPNESRDAKLNVVLSNSFGFGGQNACLVLSRPRGSVN